MSNNQYPPGGYQYNQYQQGGFPQGNANYQPPSQPGFAPGSANYYQPPPQAGFPPGSANYYQPPPQAGFPPGNANAYPPPQSGFPPGSGDPYQQAPPPNYAAATGGGSQGYPQDRKWLYEPQPPQDPQGGQVPYSDTRGMPVQGASYPSGAPPQWGGQGQFQQYQQYQQQQQPYQQYPQQGPPAAGGGGGSGGGGGGAAQDYYGSGNQDYKGQYSQQPYQQPYQQPPYQQPYQGPPQQQQQQQFGAGYPQQGQYGQPGPAGDADRGMGSTLVGGVAGAYVGKKLGMGKFMGAAGGAMVANMMGKKHPHHKH